MPDRNFYVRSLTEQGGVLRPTDVPVDAAFASTISNDEQEALIRTFGEFPEGAAALDSAALDTWCASNGISRAALEAAGVPGAGPSEPEPAWVEDFDYEDFAALMGSSGAYSTRTAGNNWNYIDHEDSPAGWPASLVQPFGSGDGGDPDGEEKHFQIHFDHEDVFGEKQREVWFEVWSKFSSNWDTDIDGCGGAPDFKWIFWFSEEFDGSTQDWPRFQLKTPHSDYRVRWEFSSSSTITYQKRNLADQLWDGQWRRIRVHMRGSSGLGQDDFLAWVQIATPNESGGFDLFFEYVHEEFVVEVDWTRWRLGANYNHKECLTETQEVKFAGAQMWLEDPGWPAPGPTFPEPD